MLPKLCAFVPLWLNPVLILTLISCTENHETVRAVNLFDSEKYFSEEASRLSSVKSVKKISTYNSTSETKEITITNWTKELEPFIQCNINKPSFRNSYRIDSITNASGKQITYSVSEPQLTIKKVEVNTLGEKIIRIRFVTGNSNNLYSTSRTLVYIPDSGYAISGQQRISMGKQTNYSIQVRWK